jgi:cytochrome c peroxidase
MKHLFFAGIICVITLLSTFYIQCASGTNVADMDTTGVAAARVALGRRLFFEPRLSANGTTSCATCHDPKKAFTDGKARSVGLYGHAVPHNAPSLINVRQFGSFNWATPDIRTLERQMNVPLFGVDPPEMGMSVGDESVLKALERESGYKKLFERAFVGQKDPYVWSSVRQAIGAFERTLVSYESPYDRALRGDSSAMNATARRGMQVFESLGCVECHTPPFFSNGGYYAVSDTVLHGAPLLVHATGGSGGYYRVPSLRNVLLTAPYFHDGRAAGLVFHGVMREGVARPFSTEEQYLLRGFLGSLTDSSVLRNPKFLQ